jgi:hypothetical protein
MIRILRFAFPALLAVSQGLLACSSANIYQKGIDESIPMLSDINISTEYDATVVKIYATHKIKFSSYRLAEPSRLVLEIPNFSVGSLPQIIGGKGEHVSSVLIGKSSANNFLRIEIMLVADPQYQISEKKDYLELVFRSKGNLAQSVNPTEHKSTYGNISNLAEEVDRLNGENLELKKSVLKFEEENLRLRRNLEESSRQLDESNKFSRAMQLRVESAEKQLDEIETKLKLGLKEGSDRLLGDPSLSGLE